VVVRCKIVKGLSYAEDKVQISVKDNGVGITKED